jgi:2-phospho-L-lactate/phosphoenolpyruvate guanylyltransferase
VAKEWTVVIPVKRLGTAKSRLRGAVPDARHKDLALAMLRDTTAAALGCAEVADLLVVTDDPAATRAVTALGAHAVPDRPGAGLNAAVRFGADVVTGLGRRRAALAGDLPALRPAELGSALSMANGRGFVPDANSRRLVPDPDARSLVPDANSRSFVPDADGTGTVLLAAAAGIPLDPRFGAGSAAAHAGSGATELTGDWPGLRQDVDTAADLRAVLALGAGAHTYALLRDLGLTAGGDRSCQPAARAR